jgi:cytochrome b involved in lipid metabolism
VPKSPNFWYASTVNAFLSPRLANWAVCASHANKQLSRKIPGSKTDKFPHRQKTTFKMAEKQLTYQDVAEHNTKKDLYVVIHDQIYDVTKFVDEHP